MTGNVKTAVVGRKYYDVEVEQGEILKMVPEPTNEYDPHAVAVYNVDNQKVGYVTKKKPAWGIEAKDVQNTYCKVQRTNKTWTLVHIVGELYGYKAWTAQGGK